MCLKGPFAYCVFITSWQVVSSRNIFPLFLHILLIPQVAVECVKFRKGAAQGRGEFQAWSHGYLSDVETDTGWVMMCWWQGVLVAPQAIVS